MYLALLAGGQIMKRIVKKTLGVSGDHGLDLFEFKTVNRTELRQQIKTLIDNLELSIEEKIVLWKRNYISFTWTTWSQAI